MNSWKIIKHADGYQILVLTFGKTATPVSCGITKEPLSEVMGWLAMNARHGDNIVLPDGTFLSVAQKTLEA